MENASTTVARKGQTSYACSSVAVPRSLHARLVDALPPRPLLPPRFCTLVIAGPPQGRLHRTPWQKLGRRGNISQRRIAKALDHESTAAEPVRRLRSDRLLN